MNIFKYHKKNWKLFKESKLNETTLATKKWADKFLACAALLKPISEQIKQLDKKFPQRPDGSTVLESSEIINITEMFEKISSYFNNGGPGYGMDDITAKKHAKNLVERIGNYFVVISEYSGMVAGLEQIILDLGNAVQKIRKEFRNI